mmetsp:Transcript_9078/g.23910  ORF Transcript_9078/g.23910 Transcript_9078/m.23910 type:complete len:274 (-) Transcript_9078:322-1143(-)
MMMLRCAPLTQLFVQIRAIRVFFRTPVDGRSHAGCVADGARDGVDFGQNCVARLRNDSRNDSSEQAGEERNRRCAGRRDEVQAADYGCDHAFHEQNRVLERDELPDRVRHLLQENARKPLEKAAETFALIDRGETCKHAVGERRLGNGADADCFHRTQDDGSNTLRQKPSKRSDEQRRLQCEHRVRNERKLEELIEAVLERAVQKVPRGGSGKALEQHRRPFFMNDGAQALRGRSESCGGLHFGFDHVDGHASRVCDKSADAARAEELYEAQR